MYYFTDWSGNECKQGEYPKNWFDPACPDAFTSKHKRDKARRKRLRARIAELKQELKEVGKYERRKDQRRFS